MLQTSNSVGILQQHPADATMKQSFDKSDKEPPYA